MLLYHSCPDDSGVDIINDIWSTTVPQPILCRIGIPDVRNHWSLRRKGEGQTCGLHHSHLFSLSIWSFLYVQMDKLECIQYQMILIRMDASLLLDGTINTLARVDRVTTSEV